MAGSTSHTVILARSFAIPTIIGLDAGQLSESVGQPVIIDGHLGAVVTEITDSVERYYSQEQKVMTVATRQAKYRELAADSRR